jgi:hypothetical protein
MNKNKIKRREEKAENNKKNLSKNKKRKNRKNSGVWSQPVNNFDPKILLEGSAKLRWAGRGQGTSHFIASSVCMWSNVKKKAFDVGGPSSIDFIYFWGSNNKQRSCVGRGGARAASCFAWQ